MNKRTVLITTMSLLFFLMGIKQATAQTLVLHHADGTKTDVELYTQPQIKFQNNKVLITSTVLSMEYPKEDILRFTYKGGSSSINGTNNNANYTQENGQIIFHDITAEKIAIYTASGIRVPVSISRNGNTVTLPLKAIPSGVYLLNVNGRTSKFTKR